jgi:hypothetical protein
MGIKCFLVTGTLRARLSLRRYWGDNECAGSYHNALTPIGEGTYLRNGDARSIHLVERLDPNETRWPTACEKCGAVVPDAAEKQLFSDHIYVDVAGKEYSLRDPIPGMMWDAWWSPECWKGPDGLSLVVNCPNGAQWMIDGPASNCTQKDDQGPYGVAHRCWTRTGTPPLISVGKGYGKTCAAGGGSIQARDYHGFLGSNGAEPGYFT